ncbi:MAG: hypothetical protein ACOCP2_02790, partial [Halohasta sp.]
VSVTEFSVADISLSVGPEVLLRVFLGSVLISAVIGVVGYFMALRFIAELNRREIEVVDKLPELLSE